MAEFTPTQGRYLAFIHAYTERRGYPPSETEIAAAMCVSPPSVNQMVKQLEKKGLIDRQPGQPRSIQVRISEEELPPWGNRKSASGSRSAKSPPRRRAKLPDAPPVAPPVALYVLETYLQRCPERKSLTDKAIIRTIEIRGDQTLEQLHQALFEAYDRTDQRPYEFHLGKRPYDPNGPSYRASTSGRGRKPKHNARTTKIDDLELITGRGFGYRFDFKEEWYHHLQVTRIDQAIPTVTYPRVVRRTGRSPSQLDDR